MHPTNVYVQDDACFLFFDSIIRRIKKRDTNINLSRPKGAYMRQ